MSQVNKQVEFTLIQGDSAVDSRVLVVDTRSLAPLLLKLLR